MDDAMNDARALRRGFLLPDATEQEGKPGQPFQDAQEMQNAQDNAETIRRMALADLSLIPRVGFKGAGAPAWLAAQGALLPDAPNTARPQTDGSLIAALSTQEHLILSPINNDNADDDGENKNDLQTKLEKTWSLDDAPQCYRQPRADSHFWFAITGEHSPDTLAKLCGVDTRPQSFAPMTIAQTSLALVNAIIIRAHNIAADSAATATTETPLYHLLADSASAQYIWDCLKDATKEFNGGVVSVNTLVTTRHNP